VRKPATGDRLGSFAAEGCKSLRASEAKALGRHILHLIVAGELDEAHASLSPALVQRIPFRTLDWIGEEIGAGPVPPARAFLQGVVDADSLGGWPIVGSALARQMDRDPTGVLKACRGFIITGGKWFSTDILAERVLGCALASDFEGSLEQLSPWRDDRDRWVRRALGVGIHNWGKRSHGSKGLSHQADVLLAFLEPLFEENELDAVKGIGWGLKTIGRFYPDRLARWLHDQLFIKRLPHRKLMLRKALTYLSQDQRALAQGARQPS